MRRVPIRDRAPAVALLVAAAAAGCMTAPFERTNPYDPDNTYDYLIEFGPDTTFSLRDTILADLQFPPEVPFVPTPIWESSDSATIGPMGGGVFEVFRGTLIPRTVQIAGGLALRRWEHTIVVRRRVTRVLPNCTFPCRDTARSYLDPWEVSVTAVDARNFPISDVYQVLDSTAVIIRDTSVVSLSPRASGDIRRTVRANRDGTTWVVFSLHGGLDSVRFVVRQRIVNWLPSCYSSVAVGASVTNTLTPYDSAGHVYRSAPPAYQWDAGNDAYEGTPQAGAEATVAPDGQVTGVTAGAGWTTRARLVSNDSVIATCTLAVTP